MPPFMWNNIFGLLNYLVPGITLAIFAAFYQNRRKREIQIEGNLAVSRIDSYEQVLSLLFEVQKLETPTLADEQGASSILSYFDLDIFHYGYPKMFEDEKTFDTYYKKLQDLERESQYYLDYRVSEQLNQAVSFFTTCKNHLDAFVDTEHTKDLKLSEKAARKHIDWVYRLFGMLLYSQCTRVFVEMDDLIISQLTHFTIKYRRHTVRKVWRKLRDSVLFFFDKRRTQSGIVGKVSLWVLEKAMPDQSRTLLPILLSLPEIMRYVHFSDHYTPADYFEGHRRPTDAQIALYNKVYLSQLHMS